MSAAPAALQVVRVPNHLGDLVMALPALQCGGPGTDVLVVRWLAPLLETARAGHAEAGGEFPVRRVIPLDRGARGVARAARELRRERYARGVLLTPSFSSALVLVAGGIRRRRGTATDSRRALLTDPVPASLLARVHRRAAYLMLMAGEVPAAAPEPRLPLPERARAEFLALAGPSRGDRVGVFPGSNASSRRWEADRFRELVARLRRGGAEVLVFGGPGERELTREVARGGGVDLGGRTGLATLAAGLASCTLVVSNDSGPLHLAAAVGAPTVSLWGAGDPEITGVAGAGHRMLRRPDLPCVPCTRNRCPRQGAGYLLPDASRECLRLIGVDDVESAVLERLQGATT